jgi:hypothetical protein
MGMKGLSDAEYVDKMSKVFADDDINFIKEARICVSLFLRGWDKKSDVKALAKVSNKEFEFMWKKLKDNGYFGKGGKIALEVDLKTEDKDKLAEEIYFSTLMMMLVAKGFVEVSYDGE